MIGTWKHPGGKLREEGAGSQTNEIVFEIS